MHTGFALGGVGFNAVLCKTCSVHVVLCVLEQPTVDNYTVGLNWLKAGPSWTCMLMLFRFTNFHLILWIIYFIPATRKHAPTFPILSRNCSTSSQQDYETEDTEYDIRQKILRASLPFVHQHGWTSKALVAGTLLNFTVCEVRDS